MTHCATVPFITIYIHVYIFSLSVLFSKMCSSVFVYFSPLCQQPNLAQRSSVIAPLSPSVGLNGTHCYLLSPAREFSPVHVTHSCSERQKLNLDTVRFFVCGYLSF
ncbi:hypothetical protein CHARACLAT_026586 [Characodon lateralis]|uniref:Secreted protein n=1 Tax=Characodon lateralis TaxID=208331 RepID=A0ABU7DCY1_9TELE|nr:hypothetical protein [Characodon lateralis]